MVIYFCMIIMYSITCSDRPPTLRPDFHGYKHIYDSKLIKPQSLSNLSTATTHLSDDEGEEFSISKGEVTYEDGVPVTTITWKKVTASWWMKFIQGCKNIRLGKKE